MLFDNKSKTKFKQTDEVQNHLLLGIGKDTQVSINKTWILGFAMALCG